VNGRERHVGRVVAGLVFALGAVFAINAAGRPGDAGPRGVHWGEGGGQRIREHRGRMGDDEFGAALASLGDTNGDGRPEYVVGAVWDATTHPAGGSLAVFSGGGGERLLRSEGRGPDWAFGAAVAGVGDLDRDGVPDLAVGVAGSGKAGEGAGGAVLLLSGRTAAVLHTLSGETVGDQFGHAVAGIGDVDGDGVPDVLVGAPGTWKENVAGSAHVFSGATGRRLHTLVGPRTLGDRFGFAVSGAGDLDGDGRPEFLVGCLGEARNGPHSGAVYVFSGAGGVLFRKHHGDGPRHELGHGVADAGDVDSDGVRDVLAGAFLQRGNGYARVYSGRTGERLYEFRGDVLADGYAHSVAGVGDVDGDGVADLAVGAPNAIVGGLPDVGYVRIYSGRSGSVLVTHRGDRGNLHLGYVVAAAGDVDGDGLADLLVGSNIHDGGRGLARVLGVPKARGADGR